MAIPSINIAGRIVEDSNFSLGRSMFESKPWRQKSKLASDDKVLDILQKLSMVGGATLSTLTLLCNSYRITTEKLLIRLFREGLVKNVSVATEHTIFKLWLPTDVRSPRNAQEACRLAILGAFFSLAIKEIPNLKWRIIRNNRSPVLSEMTFVGKNGEEKWIIDVPRRGEEPQENASLYIYPTIQEAIKLAPKGSRFTSDLYLLKNLGTPLKERLFEHTN